MIRLADYVVRQLADWGLGHVFLVVGGGAMHLNDAFGQESRIRYICCHHEQAAAMAAEGYARVSGKPGLVCVTTGPGGMNALNGVFGAWTDSIPMLVISGQVKRETCMAVRGLTSLRQLGDQEVDIVRMVRGITKYAVLIEEPDTIRHHLARAFHLARAGRPGPCWLDIPVDVQAARIDPESQRDYDPEEDRPDWPESGWRAACQEVIERLRGAARPVILAGSGVRAACATEVFSRVVRKLGLPVTTAWTHDIIASDDPLFCGRPGTIGQRAGNFVAQNADVLLVLGSRLNIRQVSYNWQSFAREAFKIQVDVDRAELDKPTVRPDLPVHCDLRVFLEELDRGLDGWTPSAAQAKWLAWCKERVCRYPVVLPKHREPGAPFNVYHFIELLFQSLETDDVVICGNATACIVPYQVAKLKTGQRLISNSGSASMGHDLPAAVGAAVARQGRRVICLAGDGSAMFNIQELQTVAYLGLPVKIVVLNNGGYRSMRLTQAGFFGRLIGEGPGSGVSFPDYPQLGEAHGIRSARIETVDEMPRLRDLLDAPGPALCEVVLDPRQEFEPRLKSRQLADGTIVSPALEDMYPFLDPDEVRENLFIKAIE